MTTITDAPTVTVAQGALAGLVHAATGVHSFKGIPYAQNIAASNRFAPPQLVAPWTGARQAVRFADSSPQQAAGITGPTPVSPAFQPPAYVAPGDDCLALNVWVPADADGTRPAMVWLLGMAGLCDR